MKKCSKCFDCQKNVDFVAALSTGLCEGCKNVFCFQHKFKHTCEQLLQIQEKKKPLSLETIDKIIKIVSYYVSFYGVKHLNNKALVYVVALKTFNIDLSDYIQNMSSEIIERYTILYADFVEKNKDCLFFK